MVFIRFYKISSRLSSTEREEVLSVLFKWRKMLFCNTDEKCTIILIHKESLFTQFKTEWEEANNNINTWEPSVNDRIPSSNAECVSIWGGIPIEKLQEKFIISQRLADDLWLAFYCSFVNSSYYLMRNLCLLFLEHRAVVKKKNK